MHQYSHSLFNILIVQSSEKASLTLCLPLSLSTLSVTGRRNKSNTSSKKYENRSNWVLSGDQVFFFSSRRCLNRKLPKNTWATMFYFLKRSYFNLICIPIIQTSNLDDPITQQLLWKNKIDYCWCQIPNWNKSKPPKKELSGCQIGKLGLTMAFLRIFHSLISILDVTLSYLHDNRNGCMAC